jgi:hypothetical protein
VTLKEELLDVRDTYGSLTAGNVVRAASSEDHPLHGRFEWDDSIAGHKYRLSQARALIRTVHEPYVVNDEIKEVRTFHSAPHATTGKATYLTLEEIVQSPAAIKILLANAKRDWQLLFNKHKHLTEFIELVRADVADISEGEKAPV